MPTVDQSFADRLGNLPYSHMLPAGRRVAPHPPGQPEPHTIDNWCVGPDEAVALQLHEALFIFRREGYNILYY